MARYRDTRRPRFSGILGRKCLCRLYLEVELFDVRRAIDAFLFVAYNKLSVVQKV
jgi:hypothetical protein